MSDKKTALPYGEILFKKAPDISQSGGYPGFKPEVKVLPKGHTRYEGRLPLPCDIIMEQDAAITLRDGATIYADIFRPTGDEKVPAILSISPFGKVVAQGACCDEGFTKEKFHFTEGTLSGYQKFEAVDPAFWCLHGYAVLNVDSRGINSSEGNACYFGPQDAADGYDIIEWAAGQDWCNGAVTMAGNSWLGINQWYIASSNPPHLACIAPWEGWNDMYRDEYMIGGIPNYAGFRFGNSMSDTEEMEDVVSNMLAHPLLDEYWQDKIAALDKIDVPAYIVASFTTRIHGIGTFRGWRNIYSKEKWLRVHCTQEWPDLHCTYNENDLLKFFDHYMKGVDNGWEKTPRVRLSVINPGGKDIMEPPAIRIPASVLYTAYSTATAICLRRITVMPVMLLWTH